MRRSGNSFIYESEPFIKVNQIVLTGKNDSEPSFLLGIFDKSSDDIGSKSLPAVVRMRRHPENHLPLPVLIVKIRG